LIKIIVYGFLIVWTICLVYIGIPDIYQILGGSTGFYFLLPIIVCINLAYKKLSKLLWAIIFTLIVLIIVNYLYSYFINNSINFKSLTRVYVIWVPVCLILLGYALTMQNFIVFEKKDGLPRKEDIEAISNFSKFLLATFFIPLSLTIPFVFFSGSFPGIRNVNSLLYQIAMGWFIVGGLIFIFETRKIPIETLNYFAMPIDRFLIDTKKAKKVLTISTLIFVIFSSSWEIYRAHWVMWIESVIVFLIYVLTLYRFGRIIFVPSTSSTQRPTNIYLPSIKSRRTIIIGVIFLGLFFSIVLWAALMSIGA